MADEHRDVERLGKLEACVPSIQLEDDFVKYPEQALSPSRGEASLPCRNAADPLSSSRCGSGSNCHWECVVQVSSGLEQVEVRCLGNTAHCTIVNSSVAQCPTNSFCHSP